MHPRAKLGTELAESARYVPARAVAGIYRAKVPKQITASVELGPCPFLQGPAPQTPESWTGPETQPN